MAAKKVFGSAEASNLVTELRRSFDDGVTRGYEWRVTQLKKLMIICDNHEPEIVAALRDDLGKPELESSVYEVSLLRNSIKLALKQLKNWMAPEKAKTSLTTFPASAEIVSEPLGVVLVISAWNYPFLLSIDPVIGAISAGNAVVLKPSELAPASSALLTKLLEQYLDPSAVRVVEGAVTETSALLEQKWDKIFYTGSSKIGRVIMAAAAKHLTPVVLELGGKSPVVVDSDTDLKVTVRRIIVGKWGCNNGQACVSPDYILTTKEYAPKLIDAMKLELEKFYGKNPIESKDMSRIVNSNHFDRLSKLLDEKEVSDKIVYGGEKDRENLKIAPTILLDVPLDSLIMSEEIFGPLLPILTLNNLEESFDVIRSRPKPLAAYLFTHNKKLKERFAATVSAGGIVVNDIAVHLALHTLPFGGVGESGMGAYHGKFSFDAFSHKKAVLYRSLFGDSAVRYPPYSRGKLRLLKALVDSNIFDLFKVLLGLA
ncbi:Aldehyde dehydrogenase family 3 member H1 [Arabidopsis thaliana]|jgi:aldehyde dehydrogenase (NAD+)|uniref:Aldehyde dehydrogenase family 3 member H1 n=3 Tax=Arabidopsis TaxID=3701 RepID=AL3H1_ARATH|nr:aldehyde dehydrogenase 3H1 [Arabidopsis thaliana]NP_849770.1 aldehyde dehydrogenase 3H1 [Arabidopsis thaliana]Q70DU8.2 RecName: Full=Aldehyde dehydrogenase family 3 member H1; Short=AtALDH4; Short=Ath-ALDH4 [Arabidopsis thaliana]KAG7648728.1 Aldehyde/histidinol dehydrogenase [Arabidopsis thaliana x Arabidopsis arenosa]AAG50550.1 aldehyde dehydrogenase, putative [Arabidopsis thaliana]AAL59944.1 putative aldehyde dehydrogenase [Arabidopsis thaliana]AEE32025.1 aldehyde dehydrogenase 3H1 [Arab|eukprot:NP_175081.1 aldehyde dehydrogenase 3H1 [Arabidopsis thaliana]